MPDSVWTNSVEALKVKTWQANEESSRAKGYGITWGERDWEKILSLVDKPEMNGIECEAADANSRDSLRLLSRPAILEDVIERDTLQMWFLPANAYIRIWKV
jgi:hypothetical protein